MNIPPARSKGSLLLDYYNGYRAEVHSPFNAWVTGIAVGHLPTPDEELVHSITHGGLNDYRKRFVQAHPGVVFSES